jgi:hypothetical protein
MQLFQNVMDVVLHRRQLDAKPPARKGTTQKRVAGSKS